YATGGSGSSTAKRFNKNPFGGKFRFRGHAEPQFWRWVCSWARAIRKPSDLGFDDSNFKLPKLITRQHVIQSNSTPPGFLFPMEAHGLKEQRDERRRTIVQRCEKAAELANKEKSATISWCNLNPEGKLLAKLIDGAVEIFGNDSDERKEEVFAAFSNGEIAKLVTKKSIAGFGLYWQHCHHQTYFPDHSFEGWYQCVRRSWRFGQKHPVKIDVVTSEGESRILKSLERKSIQAEKMFSQLVDLMNDSLHLQKSNPYTKPETLPEWL
ncbi:MAG TPA: hypothetical protein VN516_08680, partial [Candidatus Baltobacteraceae bacterium]|nr:hypothetical protein [Candidatus Baltobacteraceae bacterium]